MKKRILSGAVLVALLILLLWGRTFFPPLTQIALAFLNLIACYEMLCRAGGVTLRPVLVAALLYADLAPFAYGGALLPPALLNCLYFFALAGLLLRYHSRWTLESFAFTLAMPLLISYGFGAIGRLLDDADGRGLFYFLMLFCFSSVADIGAYFVGSFWGRHKLSPVISPKKTVEGVLGGMALSLVATALLILLYGLAAKAWASFWLLLAVPVFCAVGVCGDLFASCVKRAAGIKDYGDLIPGHGGILDRMDSILFLAPVWYGFLCCVEVF